MGKLKRMDQIRTILEAYQATGSIKGTVRLLNASKNTVRKYVRKVKAHRSDLRTLLLLSDEELQKTFYGSKKPLKSNREQIFKEQSSFWIKELRRVGVTRYLLWEEYRLKHPDGYGYSQFCVHLRSEIGRKDLTISLDHIPGEVMQVDFTGKKMDWVERTTGEVHPCEVLVAVLPHSQHTFVIALPSQKVRDFVDGLNQAFLFFGKLPKVLLSDNLKSYVTKADRYDPKFNQLCEQLAVHYGIELRATRVAKPKDKASVENMVSTAYRRVFAPLRDQVFHSRSDLNAAIRKQLLIHNNKPYQKKEGTRQDVFQEYEAPPNAGSSERIIRG